MSTRVELTAERKGDLRRRVSPPRIRFGATDVSLHIAVAIGQYCYTLITSIRNASEMQPLGAATIRRLSRAG